MYLPDTTFNLLRSHTKVSEGCVVSCGQRSIVSKFHVENISSNNGFGGRKKAWYLCMSKIEITNTISEI